MLRPRPGAPKELVFITETLDIKLNTVGPNEGWIEYVMAVPVDEYNDKLLHSDDSVNRQEIKL